MNRSTFATIPLALLATLACRPESTDCPDESGGGGQLSTATHWTMPVRGPAGDRIGMAYGGGYRGALVPSPDSEVDGWPQWARVDQAAFVTLSSNAMKRVGGADCAWYVYRSVEELRISIEHDIFPDAPDLVLATGSLGGELPFAGGPPEEVVQGGPHAYGAGPEACADLGGWGACLSAEPPGEVLLICGEESEAQKSVSCHGSCMNACGDDETCNQVCDREQCAESCNLGLSGGCAEIRDSQCDCPDGRQNIGRRSP